MKAIHLFATAVVIAAISACNGAGSATPGMPNLPAAEAAAGRVTVRIKSDTGPEARYYLGSAQHGLGAAALANTLSHERRRRPKETTLYVYTYPGTRGYDVLMAINAAREAGLTKVVGIADYTDDHSATARAQWKYWEQEIAAIAAPSRDSIVHRQ